MNKQITKLSLLGVFVFSNFVSFITPAIVSAATPQDTYTWQRNIGASGCSTARSIYFSAVSVVLANNKIYASADSQVVIIDKEWNAQLAFGNTGTGNGQFDSARGIAADASGNIYVADRNNNRVQKFDQNGNYLSQFGAFGSGDGQFNWPRGIAFDTSGNIYVTDSNNSRVQKFDQNGNYLSKFNTGPNNTAAGHPYGIVIDSAGNIYVSNGTLNNITKFSSNGTYISTIGSSGSGPGQINWPAGLAIDSSDNIYLANRENGRIEKYSSSGSFIMNFGADNLWKPEGLAIDASGDVYVANLGPVVRFNSSGTYIDQSPSPIYTESSVTADHLCSPYAIKTGLDGNLYVTDSDWNNIKVYSKDGTLLRLIGSRGSGNGQLKYPNGIAFDGDGDMYVVDSGNYRIQKFDRNGNYLSQFGSFGSGNGEFYNHEDIAIDAAGDIYVVDSGNYRIQKFSSDGMYISQFGSECSDWDGTATNTFCWPDRIAIDSLGNIYVTDEDSYVKKFDSNGTYLSKFGGDGSGDGQFGGWLPGITIDSNGNIYISDSGGGHTRIQKFNSDGMYLSQFGTYGSGDGQFYTPYGLTTDSDGNIYIADYSSRHISVWNAPIIPSAPRNVIAKPLSSTSLRVSWAAPARVGSSPLLGYRVMYRLVGASDWTAAGETNASTLAYTIAGLTPDATYEVQVVAFNAVGDSPLVSVAMGEDVVTVRLPDALAATGMSVWMGALTGIGMVGGGVLVIRRFRS